MRACHLDVASGPFKCHFGALMYFEEILLDLKEKKEGKELMKHVVYSRLESEWHARVPWPRKCILGPVHFRNLDSRPQSKACQGE